MLTMGGGYSSLVLIEDEQVFMVVKYTETGKILHKFYIICKIPIGFDTDVLLGI